MKGWMRMGFALVAMVALATPASAQDDGLARVLDRLGRTVDRVMDNLGEAFADGDVVWSEQAEAFAWTGRLERGGTLEIKNINGSIRVVAAEGDQIQVTARTRARRSDPESVTVEMVEYRGGLTICAVYPTPPSSRRDNECAPGSGGHMDTHRNDVRVDFTVRVPRGVPFHGRSVNGSIEALDLASDVELVTVNGDVEVSTSGSASAQTVNGSIAAVMGVFDEDAQFSTVNGSIELDVPDDIDADLDAEWLNGGLESDIAIRIDGRMGRRSARGTLGEGGPRLEIKTVNGSIRIR